MKTASNDIMIKRQKSSSAPAAKLALPPPAPLPSPADHNGKDKKISDLLQRWMARNGKLVVICATALLLSVFLIPPLKVVFQLQSTKASQRGRGGGTRAASSSSQIVIPPCPESPWKSNENLQGQCPGDLKPNGDATTMEQCASSCCTNDACISWQYRRDVGCIQGKDIRLGQEKDGPAAWCSDHPPYKWNGQYVRPHKNKHGKVPDEKKFRADACDEGTWNPEEEIGQCFGLGDVKRDASGSAEECMHACCEHKNCGAWQWNKELGCFYGKGMHSCQGNGDPIAFEPFVGRRKHLESRGYKDKHGKPWKMAMP
mmetsp:Transcript_3489/g.8877  ORF Transcript_3489/g.8877 Transcript_3489/m.8877 type:complete len:314 (-) Transcript_3489:383-1324(-)